MGSPVTGSLPPKAPFWKFQDGVCSAYDSDTAHTEDHLIMAFRILDEQKEAA